MLIFTLIMLILSTIPMGHFCAVQFRFLKRKNGNVGKMRRVMVGYVLANLAMSLFLGILLLSAITQTDFLNGYAEQIFMGLVMVSLFANWYSFAEFRRLRAVLNNQ